MVLVYKLLQLLSHELIIPSRVLDTYYLFSKLANPEIILIQFLMMSVRYPLYFENGSYVHAVQLFFVFSVLTSPNINIFFFFLAE